MAPATTYCPTCKRDQTTLGIRCVVCGTQVKQAGEARPLTPASVLKAHTWLLMAPAWVLGGLMLLISDALWEERLGATRSGNVRTVRDADTFMAVLALTLILFAFARPLGQRLGGRSYTSHGMRGAANATEAALGTRLIQAAAALMAYGMVFVMFKRT